VAALAARQYGVVSTAQLRTCGLTRAAIGHRLRVGRLARLYRGVYAVGHGVLVAEGRRLAAVLAGGLAAVLSHRSGGRQWSVWPGDGPIVHITRPGGSRRGPPGVWVHVGPLEPSDVCIRDGIPCTTLARTLVDCAADATSNELRRMVNAAMRLPEYDQREVDAQLARGRPGTAALRAELVRRHPDGARTKSEFEELALPLIHAAGLARPLINEWFDDLKNEVDLVWMDEKVAVEWDSREFHDDDDDAFEHDREQSAELTSLGWIVLRFTWRQLTQRPEWTIAHIARALAARAA
jgi:hypothetical protein